jgi:23S rRNA (cytidine1920-2'-O)/16S rRNA (cytidine1409-2'-O)-methyltransferase
VAIERVSACLRRLGAGSIEVIDSPITGMEGNREFLLHALLRHDADMQGAGLG